MKNILKTIKNQYENKRFVCEHIFPELTAVCPTSGLPDFYILTIKYEPDETLIELKSLKLYLVQYRNEGIYHEELINKILEDLKSVIEPKWIFLELEVNVRGGISTFVRRYWDREKGDDIEKAIDGI